MPIGIRHFFLKAIGLSRIFMKLYRSDRVYVPLTNFEFRPPGERVPAVKT